jgi:hypothetical protein
VAKTFTTARRARPSCQGSRDGAIPSAARRAVVTSRARSRSSCPLEPIDDEHEQQSERGRRHDEEIGGYDLAREIGG